MRKQDNCMVSVIHPNTINNTSLTLYSDFREELKCVCSSYSYTEKTKAWVGVRPPMVPGWGVVSGS